MKRLGIIGGTGTLAGARLVWRAMQALAREGAHDDSDFPEFAYLNVPTVDTSASGFIPAEALLLLQNALAELSALKCPVAILLCNSAHVHFTQLERQFTGRLFNMVEFAASKAGAAAAILASRTTLESGIYAAALLRHGSRCIHPTRTQQKVVDSAISGSMGGQLHLHELDRLVFDLSLQGADSVILGCTELSAFSLQEPGKVKVIDAGLAALQEAFRLCQ